MAQDTTAPLDRPAPEAARQPGLRFVHAQATRPVARRPSHGVPLFVGFGAPRRSFPRREPPALEVDSPEHFRALVAVREGSFLGAAVDGFFANGGTLCLVLPVDGAPGAGALASAFADGAAVEEVADADLVCVPDAVSPLVGAPEEMAAVQAAVVARCSVLGDRFALLDSLPAARGIDVQALCSQAARCSLAALPGEPALPGEAAPRSRPHAALYVPWLVVPGSPGGGRAVVPPCGHVAGVYARTSARAGVGRAPANETLDGAWAAQWPVDDAQHAALNEAGVNCIRHAYGRGLRVWGARTLSGQGDWQHVPVVRVFVALRRWLERGLDDIVFEAQTAALWQRVERRVAAFCSGLFASGALAGIDEQDAYYVRCDAELNPPAGRDAGRLVAEVGLAPVVPAEFVVVRIVHDAGGTELNAI